MSTIGHRLRQARETSHQRTGLSDRITMHELADQLGVDARTIYDEERNACKRGGLSAATLMKAAEYLCCSFLWLVTGRGDLENDDNRLVEILEGQYGQPFCLPHELGRRESATAMRLNLPDHLAALVTATAFYTLVTDNGLQPKVALGDLVLVDGGQQVQTGDYVLARMGGQQLPVVRRLVECDGGSDTGYQLQTLNSEFARRPLQSLEHMLGVVMEFRSFPRVEGGYQDRLAVPAFSGKVVTLPRPSAESVD